MPNYQELYHEDVCASGGIGPTFFTSRVDEGDRTASRTCCSTPPRGTHWLASWVGLRVKGLFSGAVTNYSCQQV
jgi:hypothetical protein